MKTIVSLLITLLLSVVSLAQTFTVDGLNYSVIGPNLARLTGGTPESSDLIIPRFVTNNGSVFLVRIINSNALRNKNLTSVTIPNGVITVGQDAFRDNTELTDVTLGNSVQTLGPGAFRNADVREITLPASMTDIANGVFRDNTGLRTIIALGTTPANISTSGVDNDSFRDRSVINLTVPAGSEAAYANNDWVNFFSVNDQYTGPIGETLEAANGFTYRFISGNPNQMSIVDNTNSGNVSIGPVLTTRGITFDVVALEQDALRNNNITSVTLPNSLTTIGTGAFFQNQITSVTIPNSVITVGQDAFRDNQLTDVTLGNSVEILGPGAFRNNNITAITIPASMTSLANGVFRDNTGLRTVVALGTTPANINTSGVDNDSFRDRSVINLTVPAGAETVYANNDWVNFFSVNGQYTGEIGDTIAANNGITYRFLSGNPNQASIIDNTNSGDISFGPILSVRGIIFDVVELEQDAFRGNNITSVTIPNSVITIGTGAFFQNQITSITIPNSVITVGQDAFRDNELTEVTLGNSVEILGPGAFRNNNITAITIPASMTSLANGVFRDNTGLNTVIALGTTPAQVSTSGVDNDSFRDRSVINLTVPAGSEDEYASNNWINFFSVNGVYTGPLNDTFDSFVNGLSFEHSSSGSLPNTISVIGNTDTGAININGQVTSRGINFTVTRIKANAFENDQITSVGLPNTLIEIGANAFRTNQLTSVTIPNSVITVGQDAFRDNEGLTDVILGNSVETLGPGAFRNADVREITIPASMTAIANGVFRDNENLRIINALGANPATIVTSGIDNDSFRDRSVIGLTVPIESVPLYNASGWTGFFSVNGVYSGPLNETFINNNITYKVIAAGLPNIAHITDNTNTGDLVIQGLVTESGAEFNITEIEVNAFEGNQLTSVTFEGAINITEIGEDAFRNNQFTSVTIPNSVTAIGVDAFRDNQLTTVTLGNSVETLGPGAFRNNNINEITLPASITDIANGVFRDNVSFVRVIALGTTPASIVNSGVDNDSFRDRSRVTLTVPEGFETIYENAGWTGFFGVNGVYTGPIGATSSFSSGFTFRFVGSNPNQATIIGNDNSGDVIIPGRPNLKGVRFDVIEIEDDAFRNDNITSVTIPDSVVDIGTDAFRDNQITSVSLGNSVETLGPGAFRNNQIEEILLPASMTDIANGVFRDNTTLIRVIAVGATPAAIVTSGIDNDSFRDRSVIDLFVPQASTQDYIDAGWTGFASINNLIRVGVEFVDNGLSYRIIDIAPNKIEATGGVNIPTDLVLPATIPFEGEDFTLVHVFDSAFFKLDLTSVTLPTTIRSIGDFAFDDNELAAIELPEGLETIGIRGLRANNMSNIIIPSTVTSIGENAFGANPWNTVTALGTTPVVIQENTFGGSAIGADLFIPEGTTQDYLDAGWTGFNITEFTVDITVAPKVFLQGAATNPIAGEEDLMRDSLRENGLLPTTSPYGDGATVNPVVFTTTGANAIVDWVRVELRTGVDSDNTTIVNSKAALLQRDGDIVDLDGSSNITFTEEDGDYFIAIIHRNHIGVMAAVPAPLSSTVSTLDFTQDAAFAKGENLALTEVNGTFAMIAGDADGSSQILNTDITEALSLAGGSEAYSTADADMNGFVLNSDIQLLVLANSGTVQQFE